jgi:toxin ParE1/3/4
LHDYRLSTLARLDLVEIADYTVDTWGLEHAERYLDSLEACFRSLVGNPGLGRPCEKIRKGLRRFEHEKHVIFYRSDEDGIFIVRILHHAMLPDPRLME